MIRRTRPEGAAQDMEHASFDDDPRLARLRQAVQQVDAGIYSPGLLADLLERNDDLAQLARAVDALGRSAALRRREYQLLRKVIPIGVALSAERDFNRLLESVVTEAQAMTGADAGTLYLLEDDALRFVILHNNSLNLSIGGTSGEEVTFPPVALHRPDGTENHSNVASHVALTGREIMIDDAYDTAEGFDLSGTKAFDSRSGYHSKSFFTLPLKGKDGSVIGVLQLINARDPETGEIVPFSPDESLWSLVLLATAALDAYIREDRLRAEIARLQIQVDDQYRASQVAQITDTRYFRELQDRARELRSRRQAG